MRRFSSILFLAAFVFPAMVKSQGTFTQIYNILQTHCAGSGCHDGSTPIFNVNVTEDSLYRRLVNVDPVNPAAVAKHNKLILPGEPVKSYLLRKICNGISDGLVLKQPDEGAYMPNGLPALKNYEIELVRQWVLFAAKDTGNTVDTALINTYYRNGGIDQTYSPHLPPPTGQGFQMYLGRIFLPPNTEHEYFVKYNPEVTSAVEVPKLVSMMPNGTHHFLLFTFNPGTSTAYPAGLRDASEGSMPDVQNGLGTGPGLWQYVLPTGCAYYWYQNLIFDVNFHVKNSSPDSIMSTDLYVNVYTQPVGTAQHYMKSINFPDFDIVIPPNHQTTTFSEVGTDSTATNMWRIWCLYSHTHQYGTAFNLFRRNADLSKGEEIYDGNYSYEQGFDVGYYRTGPHATFRYFGDTLLTVDPRVGIIGEASWVNTSPDTVWWGLTSDQEMMVMGFQYIDGDPLNATAVSNVKDDQQFLKIFPNPAHNKFVLSYETSDAGNVQAELFNVIGQKQAVLFNNVQQAKGPHTQTFNAADYHLAPGVYFINFTADNKTTTEKLVISE